MTTKDFSKKKVKTETVSVDKLLPNPKNPRIDLKPGMPLYEKLKKSINEFDYLDPIIWNKRTGYLVSGHQRLQVMKDLAEENGTELKEVDVVVADMPESKADAYMVAVNKITGLWDQEKLSALFKELEEDDLQYTGFDDFEIASLLKDEEPIFGDDIPSIYTESGEEKDIFSIAFTFPMDKKLEINRIIKKDGKEAVTAYVLAEILKHGEDDA